MVPRVIVLNGPVGVGKTTLLNELKTHLHNCYVVSEYIDVLDDAETKLKLYLEGSISALEFQDYILDYYESIANQLKDSNYDYILVERSPVEGIVFFAKLDLMNHRLTQTQYDYLLTRAQSISFYPNSLIDNAITISTEYMSPNQITELIISIISDFDIRIIKLRASLTTLKQRIQQRGRQCELEHYTDNYMKTMIEAYL